MDWLGISGKISSSVATTVPAPPPELHYQLGLITTLSWFEFLRISAATKVKLIAFGANSVLEKQSL